MRVLYLEFENLNSLRGRHVIDFANGPLAEAGIFAITGATGAGKTTILDAITLALFGRAARYATAQPRDMMTRHTADCFAEIHFEARDGAFGARWELRRARGKAEGEFQPAKRLVYSLPDHEPIQSKTRALDEWIEEQTGLDYERFLRSVLLAQGEFTAFLKSSEKERGHLLESLTGMAIYGELSRLAFETAREKRHHLAGLRLALESTALLDEGTLAVKAKELTEATAAWREGVTGLERQREELAWRRRWRGLQEDRARWAERWRIHDAEASQAQERLDILARHRATVPLADEIQGWRLAEERRQELANRRAALAEESRRAAQALALAQAREASAKTANEAAATSLARLRETLVRVIPLDERLARGRAQLAVVETELAEKASAGQTIGHWLRSLRETREQKSQAYHQTQEWLRENQRDAGLEARLPRILGLARQQEQALRQWKLARQRETEGRAHRARLLAAVRKGEEQRQVAQAGMDHLAKETAYTTGLMTAALAEKPRVDWEDKLASTSAAFTEWKVLLTLAEQHESWLARQREFPRRLEEIRQQEERSREQVQTGTATLAQRETMLERRRLLVRRVEEIRALRAELAEGEPCPVCGASAHPQRDLSAEDPDEQAIKWEETALVELRRELELARAEHARVLERRDSLKNEADSVVAEIERLLLAMKSDGSAIHLNELRRKGEDLEAEQRAIRQRLAEHQQWQMELAEHSQQHGRMAEEARRLEQRLAHDQGQAQAAKQARLAHEVQLAQAEDDAAVMEKELASALAETGEAVAANNPLAAVLERLRARQEEFARKETEVRRIAEELSESDTQCRLAAQEEAGLAQAHAEISSRRAECEELVRAVSRERWQLFAERDPEVEHARAEETARQAACALEEAAEALGREGQAAHLREANGRSLAAEAEATIARQNSLGMRLVSQGAASLETLLADHLPPPAASALEALEREVHTSKIRLETEQAGLEQMANELAGEGSRLGIQQDAPAALEERHAALETRAEAVQAQQRRVWELEQELQQDAAARARQAEQGRELEVAEKEQARWERLSELIGSANGSVFSRFAQSLTLEQLVILANRHLDLLTGRYRIQRRVNTDLEIEVIDRHQANAIRGTQSLSGGESFLTSLALALALAELASGKARIDSLFIDEGFGTLDEQSLEVAISALEALHARNKIVGVISHHELIKERLATRIHVAKGLGGVSTLEVIQDSPS